ncbi:hypothetical protein CCP4SC76_7960003 [Gammaproteobacteria bacterium]
MVNIPNVMMSSMLYRLFNMLIFRMLGKLFGRKAPINGDLQKKRQIEDAFSQYLGRAALGRIDLNKCNPIDKIIIVTNIRHYVIISEKISVLSLSDMVNEYYSIVSNNARYYGADIDDFYGDHSLITFELEGSYDKVLERAILFAITMQKSVDDNNKERIARSEHAFNITIGITSGEVFLGVFGNSLRKKCTVIGGPVNSAFMAAKIGNEGQICVPSGFFESCKSIIRSLGYLVVEVEYFNNAKYCGFNVGKGIN